MNTMMPLRHKNVVIPLGLALFAPILCIVVLFGGTEHSDYGRQTVKEEWVLTMLIPGLALWAGGVVLALGYYLVSNTISLYCSYAWAALSALLGGAALYVLALCTIPQDNTGDLWFSSVYTEDTMQGGLIGAALLGILALPIWIHYGIVRAKKALRRYPRS